MEQKKMCNTCLDVLPLGSFGIRKTGSADGYAGWCKSCAREYHRSYRKDNPERIRAIMKKSRQKNHETYLAYQRYATQMRKESVARSWDYV